MASRTGSLIIIGGREDRAGEMTILHEIAKRTRGGKLVVATLASRIAEELWEDYYRLFRMLGVKRISHLDVVKREHAVEPKALKAVAGARTIFFTGGDQLRITSELGGSPVCDKITAIYENGGVIAGTSAGASAMSEIMLVSGSAERSYRIGAELRTIAGLGFAKNMIIDQHFAERGRITRLIGAVAANPKFLGVGIDEDTALILERGTHGEIIGRGAVYILDAHDSTHCNISEAQPDATLSIFNVRVHVLSEGDSFDFTKKDPSRIQIKSAA